MDGKIEEFFQLKLLKTSREKKSAHDQMEIKLGTVWRGWDLNRKKIVLGCR